MTDERRVDWSDGVIVAGVALVGYGAWLIAPALCFAVAGVALIAVGVAMGGR